MHLRTSTGTTFVLDFQIFLISFCQVLLLVILFSFFLQYVAISRNSCVNNDWNFCLFFVWITMSGLLWWISRSALRPHSLLCLWGNTHTICHCTQLHIPCIPPHVWPANNIMPLFIFYLGKFVASPQNMLCIIIIIIILLLIIVILLSWLLLIVILL